jgi:hypothetical protein
MTDPITTEAVILVRQGTRTMAVHLPRIMLVLTPIVDEPPIPHADLWFYRGPSVTGYEVEATGVADRFTIWEGTDPFQRGSLEEPVRELE